MSATTRRARCPDCRRARATGPPSGRCEDCKRLQRRLGALHRRAFAAGCEADAAEKARRVAAYARLVAAGRRLFE